MTRERIVHTARQIFSELGYDATTYQAIAGRAGLTRPAINYYFADKRKLYGEVVKTTSTIVSTALQRAAHAPTLTAQVAAFTEALTDATAQDRSAAAFLVTSLLESQRHPDLRRADNNTLTAIREFLSWAVNSAVERGELAAETNSSALVEMLLALLWGVSFYAGFLDRGDGLSGITEQLRQTLGGRQRQQPGGQPLRQA